MQNNRRNKNFQTTKISPSRSHSEDNRSYGVLPAPGILESYEEIAPGAVKTILEMARSEQAHRHKWETNYLRVMAYNQRISKLLILTLAVIFLFTSASFMIVGDFLFACIIVVLGFAFLSILVYSVSRSKPKMLNPRQLDERQRRKFK